MATSTGYWNSFRQRLPVVAVLGCRTIPLNAVNHTYKRIHRDDVGAINRIGR